MSAAGPGRISNFVKWTICVVASLGFLFDIYVVLVGPFILQAALIELGNLKPGTPEYRDWAGNLFWIPPLVGGFCGLWGGYLADRFGGDSCSLRQHCRDVPLRHLPDRYARN
jgi:hypothetical protein